MDNKITIRLAKSDTANIIAIATAMRTDAAPFVTRTEAMKFALATVAADPQKFLAARDGE
jgi:hypothetical protein